MMSRAYYCKVRDILKRQMWLAALWFVILFFALPVQTALRLQARYYNTIEAVPFAQQAGKTLLEIFGMQSYSLTWILMPMALISALVFGSFMHKQRQVDFFHSQPILRRTLLLQNSLAGLASLLLPYLLNLLLTLAVAVMIGAAEAIPWGGMLASIGVHILYSAAIFATVMLAMVISGNGAVALVTGVFLLGVFPAMLALGLVMAQEYYPTFYQGLYDWVSIIRWLSPAAAYACVPINGLPHTIFPIIIYDALVIGLVLRLFGLRPSEAAGQAIAFPAAKPILKYLMALLAATCFALVFHSISNVGGTGDLWWYFGAITGGFLATQISEIVYAFDFRAIRRHLLGWAVFMIAYMLVFTGLMHDITGFNTRVPAASQVVKAEVYLTGVNSYYYSSWGYNFGYYSRYQDELAIIQRSDEDMLAQSIVETPEAIAAAVNIAHTLVERPLLSDYYYREGLPIRINNTSMKVIFTLDNGSKIARDYSHSQMPVQYLFPDIAAIYEDEGFVAGLLEQLEYPAEQYLPEHLEIFDAFYSIAPLPQLTLAQREALTLALRTDLALLTPEYQQQNMPIGALRLRLYANPVDYDEMSVERNSRPCRIQRWPIYASFSHTLSLLAQLGYSAELWQPDLENVREARLINNYYYDESDPRLEEMMKIGSTTYVVSSWSEKSAESTPITDRAEIERLVRESYAADGIDLNCFINIDNLMELEIVYEGMGGQTFFQRRVFPY